jgi:hypothetical protein
LPNPCRGARDDGELCIGLHGNLPISVSLFNRQIGCLFLFEM